jgi:hypothetical protein
MVELPNEIQFKIIKKLDIDTRRSLGIYTKLKIPNKLLIIFNNICRKIKNTSSYSQLNINNIYNLIVAFDNNEAIDFRLLYNKLNKIKYYIIWTILD